MTLGGFTFVLHSHMPFCTGAGLWPDAEESLHEMMADSYLPLLEALTDLHEAGVPVRLTLSITPVLAEQLADPLVISSFEAYLERQMAAAQDDVARFEQSRDLHLLYLAHYYLEWYRHALQSFCQRLGRDIVGGFRRLQDAGVIEILTSAATHPYLPLMARDSTIHAQLEIGKRATMRLFGREPRAIWLPECAYRPAYYVTTPDGSTYERPGLEEYLQRSGLKLFVSAGDEGSTFEPCYVRRSDVAVMGRNRRLGEPLLAAHFGYPADPNYRELHRKDPAHGFRYWRVTGRRVDLQYKRLYEPYHAGQRVQAQAHHFVMLVEKELAEFAGVHVRPGLAVLAQETELFGHHWFEGIAWLKEVLRRLACNPDVELCAASEWLDRHPPEASIDLPESSWRRSGTHTMWLNPETSWMWDAVHAAEARMERLVERYADAEGREVAALNEASRELVLLEASDWELLYTTGQARQYAAERFSEHVTRFNTLADALEKAQIDAALSLAAEYAQGDNPFPDIDYRLFASRQRI